MDPIFFDRKFCQDILIRIYSFSRCLKVESILEGIAQMSEITNTYLLSSRSDEYS